VSGPVLDAGIDELLLEGGDEVQAARLFQRLDGAAQELARAALPGRAVGVADVAEEEMLRRRAIAEIDPHLGVLVSGTTIRSPPVPKGVLRIGPKAVCIKLEWVQPIPFLCLASISLAGNPLPRTWPAMSQVPTKISSSRIMMLPYPL
jgi:hypothetical protein